MRDIFGETDHHSALSLFVINNMEMKLKEQKSWWYLTQAERAILKSKTVDKKNFVTIT